MAKSKEEILFESRKLVYENASQLHRYFLTWRHQLLAGYLAVLAALGVAFNWASLRADSKELWIGAIGLLSISLTALFWLLEFRNRQLYRGCQNIARNLEQLMGLVPEEPAIKNGGVYDELIRTTSQTLNHSTIMNMFFAFALLLLIALTLAGLFTFK